MYRVSRSAVLLDGECSEAFDVQQGVAQGCSLSPILFLVFINGLLKEVEQAGLGVELSDGSTIGGMLFADDFVGVSNSEEALKCKTLGGILRCRLWMQTNCTTLLTYARYTTHTHTHTHYYSEHAHKLASQHGACCSFSYPDLA